MLFKEEILVFKFNEGGNIVSNKLICIVSYVLFGFNALLLPHMLHLVVSVGVSLSMK